VPGEDEVIPFEAFMQDPPIVPRGESKSVAALAEELARKIPTTPFAMACATRADIRAHVEATARSLGLEGFESSVSKNPKHLPFELGGIWTALAFGGLAVLALALVREASPEVASRRRDRGVIVNGWWRPGT
jgi:hypothetical protein